jgi:hypothetical protein
MQWDDACGARVRVLRAAWRVITRGHFFLTLIQLMRAITEAPPVCHKKHARLAPVAARKQAIDGAARGYRQRTFRRIHACFAHTRPSVAASLGNRARFDRIAAAAVREMGRRRARRDHHRAAGLNDITRIDDATKSPRAYPPYGTVACVRG